jgi:glycosyltransferase involved in cell wall biosynthesis
MRLVSVIIPAWNVAGFIDGAVASVLAQTWSDIDLVVVNDGSPDTPRLDRVLARYAEDPRLRTVVQENRGPSGARNTGVLAARGEWVAFLDGDDWWEPEFVARQMAYLAAHPDCDLVYCDARLFGDSPLAGRTFMDTAPSDGPVTIEALSTLRCNVPTSCVVARRERLMTAGLFDETFRRTEDFDLWWRMLNAGASFGYHREVLVHHRIHQASAVADQAALFESQAQVFRKLAALAGPAHRATPLLEAQVRRAEADLALERVKGQLVARQYDDAATSLRAARRVYGTLKLALAELGLRTAPELVRRLYVARQAG